MRRLNMDYLLSGPGDEVNLSLQDMIECDMKTEFDEPLTNGTNISLTGDDLDSSLADSLAPGTDLHHHHHLDKDVDCKPDRTWLQSVSLSTSVLQSDSASEVFQMVNPQTGLPVQTDSGSSSPTSGVLSVSSASTGRPAIQYVTTTAAVAATAAQQQQHQAQQRASGTSTAACTGASTISAPAVTNSTTVLRQRNITVTTAATNTVSTAAAHQLHCLHNSKLITQALSSGTTVTLSSVAYQQLLQQQQQQSSRNGASLVTQQLLSSNNNHLKPASRLDTDAGKVYPKPVYSYSCLIAMALKNSETGALPVSEIYTFMTENFPYFKTAPDGWKNSVRHNLSLNKCFEKIENPKATGSTRKGCLWGLNPAKIGKMDEEIAKWRKKDLEAIQRSMAKPEVLEKLEKGNLSSHNQRRHLANNTTNSSDQEPTREDLVPLKNKLVSYAAAAPNTKPIIGDIQLSMIEIKPAQNGVGHLPVKVKVEPIFTIKPESVDPSGAVGCALTAEDLSVLDSSLSLDPSLNDAALQNSVWEELGAEGISLDDIPFMSFGPSTSSSSPVTVQTAKSGSSSSCAKSPVVSLLSSSNTANGASGSHTVVTSAGLSVSHRIFAQT